MRTGIELLWSTVIELDTVCACERAQCSVCRLRTEIAEYLKVASPGGKRVAPQTITWTEP